jgi:putative SOS response-associated peptidase YedK
MLRVMCGRLNFSTFPDFRHRFGTGYGSLDLRPKPSYNIAPGTEVAVIISKDGQNRVELMQWGFVPAWAQEPKGEVDAHLPTLHLNGIINARSETAAQLPTFRKAFRSQRCLVPANSFFEWRRRLGGEKEPMTHTPQIPHTDADEKGDLDLYPA